jgi:hypothetical protein
LRAATAEFATYGLAGARVSRIVDESALDASTEATNEGPLCANTGRLQTDSVRPCEVLIEERLTSFNVSRWTATFSLCCFIFFLEAFFKIWESEHKLGAHRIGAERPSIARLPHISFQTVAYHPYLSGPASTKSLHLNQDLTNFLSRRKRGESKWDFDSRNVDYGI